MSTLTEAAEKAEEQVACHCCGFHVDACECSDKSGELLAEAAEALHLASARLHLLEVGSANRPAHEAMLQQLRAVLAKVRR